MKIRIGYELIYDCPQPTPMILTLSVHYSRVSDIIVPDHLIADPPVPLTAYRDSYGNWCSRIVAPKGQVRLSTDALVRDTGLLDVVVPSARQTPVEELADETLLFLLGSRYCETDRLSETAWQLFGQTPTGWARVQAICDYVHRHITFGYEHARPTKTAYEAFYERTGVCRDYAHLAIAFCRCMNIPARYCTGYLGDIGIPPSSAPMDFAGWFEAYLDGHWYTFDARNNMPRIGRVLIARGRDAADVAISNTFGPNTLTSFNAGWRWCRSQVVRRCRLLRERFGLATSLIALPPDDALDRAGQLLRGTVDGLVHGRGLVRHGDRLAAFETGFHHALLVVLAAPVAVLVAEMDLHARDAIADSTQRLLHDATGPRGQALLPFDMTIGIDLDLHGVFLFLLQSWLVGPDERHRCRDQGFAHPNSFLTTS
jgi:transglutaminase-like putative cysteine protease